MYRKVAGAFVFFILCSASVAQATTVVFFSGKCNSPAACRANEQANQSIGPKLTDGSKLITPQLNEGSFPNQGAANSLVSQIGNDKIVLIAYSAGYQALLQTVNAMNVQQLKQVSTIVSLEGDYSGFQAAVAKVRAVNPNVNVQKFTSGQFNTNHSQLPGSPGVADAISRLASAANNGTTADLSNLAQGAPITLGPATQTQAQTQTPNLASLTQSAPSLSSMMNPSLFSQPLLPLSPQMQPIASAPISTSPVTTTAASQPTTGYSIPGLSQLVSTPIATPIAATPVVLGAVSATSTASLQTNPPTQIPLILNPIVSINAGSQSFATPNTFTPTPTQVPYQTQQSSFGSDPVASVLSQLLRILTSFIALPGIGSAQP